MKKLVKLALSCLAVVFCSIAMTSCEPDVEGDHLYYVTTSEGTSTGSYMSYRAYAQDKILDAVKATGAIQTESNGEYFMANGSQKKWDKKMVAAVNKAMDEVESSEDYDTTIFVIDEVTLEVKRATGEGDVVLLSRKFKKQNNHN